MAIKYQAITSRQWALSYAMDMTFVALALWLPTLSNPAFFETFNIAAIVFYSGAAVLMSLSIGVQWHIRRRMRELEALSKVQDFPESTKAALNSVWERYNGFLLRMWPESRVRIAAASNARIAYFLVSETLLLGSFAAHGKIAAPVLGAVMAVVWMYQAFVARYMYRARGYTS